MTPAVLAVIEAARRAGLGFFTAEGTEWIDLGFGDSGVVREKDAVKARAQFHCYRCSCDLWFRLIGEKSSRLSSSCS
ncbi:hypothetical protein M0R45_007113 [Rubus argutus]|uniref:Uncharacterized protein n=1 Tax=Rubus argutus TaxID=59490 RepID=A0AAW1YSG3_RUBAR